MQGEQDGIRFLKEKNGRRAYFGIQKQKIRFQGCMEQKE